MSKPVALITGATGTLGWHLVNQLSPTHQIRALVRDIAKAKQILPESVELISGNLANARSLTDALTDVDIVAHAAGMPEQWAHDQSIFYRINTQGTQNLVAAALQTNISAFLYISTIDVFARQSGQLFDESRLTTTPLLTAYQRSKLMADRSVKNAVKHGLPARFIHPSALFGPSPSATPGINNMIVNLATNKLRILPPGGLPLAFAPDVARGTVAALDAPIGARFIFSDDYISLLQLAQLVNQLVPSAKLPKTLPLIGAKILSVASESWSRITRQPPLLPAGQLNFLTSEIRPNSQKARQELAWQPTPLTEALRLTLSDHNLL